MNTNSIAPHSGPLVVTHTLSVVGDAQDRVRTVAAPNTARIEADIDSGLGEAFGQALRPLPKHVAESFFHIFQYLLSKPVVEHPVSGDIAAGRASDRCVTVRIVGAGELLAAALAAGKIK